MTAEQLEESMALISGSTEYRDFADAYEYSRTGKHFGKVVIRIAD
jgi:hypothetical protein